VIRTIVRRKVAMPERPPYQVREVSSWLCFVRDPERTATIVN
jgi:hypothetical protein